MRPTAKVSAAPTRKANEEKKNEKTNGVAM